MDLNNFFKPKTIAIIGASDHIDKVGGVVMEKASRSKCNVIPINPGHKSLFGIKCYKSVLEFEGKIDLALIVIPKDFVQGVMEECGKKGIKEVIIVSAGFSEAGNLMEELKLKKIADKYGIRFIGPNCFGIFSSETNLDLTFSATTPKKGNIAMISQSGALWSYMADAFKDVGFSNFVGLGNMTDLEFSDFVEYFSQNRETKDIILYIERLKDGKRFIEVCGKCKKPIYVIKAGSSKEGRQAAFSHTGSLATDYDIYKGAFSQIGINVCGSLEQAFERITGKTIVNNSKIKINFKGKIKIITNAGGAGALASDYLAEKNMDIVESRDILGTALSSDYYAELKKTEENNIVIILTSQTMSDIEKTAEVISSFKEESGKNVVALFLGGDIMVEANRIFIKNKVKYFNNFEDFRKAI